MASFYQYLPLLQNVEGGFQKNPKDGGNYNSLGQLVGTNYGISAKFYENIIKRPPSEADMRMLSKSTAEKLFQQYFWNALNGSQINSQAIANTVVDHQVNSGRGVLLAQETLNKSFGFRLAVDGGLGVLTLTALNSVNPARFVTLYNEARANYYKTRSNSSEFAAGWLIRLKKFAVEYKKPISMVTVATVATVGFIVYHNFIKA